MDQEKVEIYKSAFLNAETILDESLNKGHKMPNS